MSLMLGAAAAATSRDLCSCVAGVRGGRVGPPIWSRIFFTVPASFISVMMCVWIYPNKVDGDCEFGGRFLYDAEHKTATAKSWRWVGDQDSMIRSGLLPGYSEFRRSPFGRAFALMAFLS